MLCIHSIFIQTENPGWMFRVFVCVSIYLFFLLSLSPLPPRTFLSLQQRLRKYIFRFVSMATDKTKQKREKNVSEIKMGWEPKGKKDGKFFRTKALECVARSSKILHVFGQFVYFSFLFLCIPFENHWNAKLTQTHTHTWTYASANVIFREGFPSSFVLSQIDLIEAERLFDDLIMFGQYYVSFIFNDAWPNCFSSIPSKSGNSIGLILCTYIRQHTILNIWDEKNGKNWKSVDLIS